MPSTAAADQSMLDADLVQAAHDLQAIDQTISDMFDKYGDDTDSRSDYRELELKRNDHIATRVIVPALSAAGVQAKATVLRLNRLIEDNEQHQQVAVSLADDIAERGLPQRPVSERLPDPVYAAIEAHETAYAAVRGACAESNRLCELADKIAGKHVVTIPDLRAAGRPPLLPSTG